MSKVLFETIRKSLFIWAVICSAVVAGQNSFETSFFSAYESIIKGEPKFVRDSWNQSDRVFVLSEQQDSLSWESELLPDYYSNTFARFFFAAGLSTTDTTAYTLWLDQKALFTFQPEILSGDTILYSYRGSSLTFHKQKENKTATEFFVELRLPLQVLSLGERIRLKVTAHNEQPHQFWIYDLKPQAPFQIQNKGITKRGLESEWQKLILDLYYFSSEKPVFGLNVNGKTRITDTLRFGYNKWEVDIETGREAAWAELDMFRNDSLVKYVGYESKPLPYHEIYLVPKIVGDTLHSESINRLVGHVPSMTILESHLKGLSETDRMKWMHQLQTGAISFNVSNAQDFIGCNDWANYYDNLSKGLLFAKEQNLNGKSLQLSNPYELSESLIPFLTVYGIEYLSIKQDDLPLVDTKEIDEYPYFYWKNGESKILCEWYHHSYPSSLLSEDLIEQHLKNVSKPSYKMSRMDVELESMEGLQSFVNYWNTTYSNPKLIISSLEQYFDAFKQQHGEKLPELTYEYIGFSSMLTDVFPESSSAINKSQEELQELETAALFAPGLFKESSLEQHDLTNERRASLENLAYKNVVEEQTLVPDSVAKPSIYLTKKYQEITSEMDSVFVVCNSGEAVEGAYVEISQKWSENYQSVYGGEKEKLLPVQRMSDGTLLVYLEQVPAYGTLPLRLSALPTSVTSDLEIETSRVSNSRLSITYNANGYLTGLQRKDVAAAYIYENDTWGGIFKQSGSLLSLWESESSVSVVEKGPLCYKIQWTSEDEEMRYTRSLILYAWSDSFEWEVDVSMLSDVSGVDSYLSFPFLLEKPTYKYHTAFGTERDKFRYHWKRRNYRMPEAHIYQVEGLEKACQISMTKNGPLYARRLDFVSDWLPSYGDNGFLYQLSSRNHKENSIRENFRFRPVFRSSPMSVAEQEIILLPVSIEHHESLMDWDDENIELKYLKATEDGTMLAVFYNNSSEESNLKLKTSLNKKIECDPFGEGQRNLTNKKKMAGFSYLFVKLEP